MKTILRLLTFLKPFTKEVAISILIGTATICAGIGMMGTSAYLISAAALHPSIAELQVAIVGVRFFGISRGIFRYLERLVSHSVNLKVLTRMRVWLYESVEKIAPAGLQMDRSGDLLNRVMSDLEVLENFFVRVVSPIIVALIITIGMSFFVGGYFSELGGLLALGMTINGLLLPLLSIILTKRRGNQLQQARASLSADLLENFQGIEDLLAAGAEDRSREKILKGSREVGKHQLNYGALTGLNDGLTLLVMNLTLVAVLMAAIPRVSAGQMSGILLAVVCLLTLASFEATTNLPLAAQNLTASIASAKRLFSLADRQPGELSKKNTIPYPLQQNPHRIDIHGLDFSYSNDTGEILSGLDLVLERGKIIAVVGPSGAGKTTLLNILLRFREYNNGCIQVDGQDLQGFDEDSTRRLFGVIAQDSYLFAETLRNNLLLARPDASDDDLIKAIETAELSDWFKVLPEGLDTWLGEQGARMSGGEAQRLAIARVLLQDAPFVLLDEPTGHLDAKTEEILIHSLFKIFADKGVLLITHRLAGLKQADEIVFLKEGRVIERGSERGLLEKGEAYARYWHIQRDQIT